MFETGVRQFRLVWSMVWGRPISPRNVERLVDDALATLHEFGVYGDDVQQLLDGPLEDPNAREEFQNRALQRTARRLSQVSPFYQKLFAAYGIAPEKLTTEKSIQVPVTSKQDLLRQPHDFITTHAHPYIATRTTGTTGQPVEMWLSKYEVELWAALSALSAVLRGEIVPLDCVQLNVSSRATLSIQQSTARCRLVKARLRTLGIIPPAESVDSLLRGGDTAPSLLLINPSYLAQLLHVARQRGLGPRDFCLRRIECGGEILSAALRRAAEETFGAPVVDSFGMTEIAPFSGPVCNQGHLHYDLNVGFVEAIDLETGNPAAPGALGTLVVTPYYPYRECMPVFRYDTQDVVRRLPDTPLTCDLARIPATSIILGKRDNVLRTSKRVVTLKDLVEVYEALPSEPWPARFSARVRDDHIEMVVSEQILKALTKEDVERHFRQAAIDVSVADYVASEQDAYKLRPVRADLLETTFMTYQER